MEVLLPIVERHSGPSFPVDITGTPPVNYAMVMLLQRDMQRFTSLAMLGVAVLLFAFFRRLSGVVLPLGIVSLSLVGTAGFMGNADLPVTAASQILPSLLLAVGIGFAVHLLTIFYQHLDRGSTREEALVLALGHSGLAIILTGLTTAGSLFSFFFADLAIISDFGLEAPFGVLLSLVYSLGLLPALLAVVPIRVRRPTGDRDERAERLAGGLDRVLVWLGDLSAQRPALVLAVWTVLLAAGVIGAAQLRPSHMPVEWLPEDNSYRRTLELVNRELHTSMSIEVIADSGEQSGLSRPDVLRAFEEIKARVMTLGDIPIGNALSVSDIVKETNQALHSNDTAHYSIPGERPLVAQELLLFEQSGPDELAKMADGALQRGRLSILLNYVNALNYKAWVESLREEIAEVAPPFVRLEITGRLMLMVRGVDGLLQGMLWSYTIALLVIVPLMMVITGGVGRGLACMVPNVVPIVVTMGVMFGLGIPLDVFTILIGSICIGVAVDDTIHFVHNFRRDFNSFGDGRGAVRRTLLTTGRALLVTSLVLSSGFVVFAFAGMENVADFGILTSFAVATAFLADVTLLPAVLILLVRRAARNTRDVTESVGPFVGTHASTASMITDT
jgi:predicted RND superfamily exporter protein